MSRTLKLLTGILALTGLAIFNAACGTEHAKVRFVHASPDAGGLDVALDGKNVATALAFGDVSPATGYLTIASGNHKVEVRDSTTKDQINSTVDFGSQKSYTLLISGKVLDEINPIAAVLKTDDNSAPSSGNIKLRVIHDAPSGPAHIDIYVVPPGTNISGLTPTISNLAYQQASDYKSLPAAMYEVIMTASGDSADVRSDGTFTLSAGQNRTLVTLDIPKSVMMSVLELADLN